MKKSLNSETRHKKVPGKGEGSTGVIFKCNECGNEDYALDHQSKRVCTLCGLVSNDVEEINNFSLPSTRKNDDFKRDNVHSAIVRDNAFITQIMKKQKFKHNEKVNRMIKIQNRVNKEENPVRAVDIENKQILEQIFQDVGISWKVHEKSKIVLEMIKNHEKLGTVSRKTSNERNIIFVSAVVSVMDERVNVRPKFVGELKKFVVTNVLKFQNLDFKFDNMIQSERERVGDNIQELYKSAFQKGREWDAWEEKIKKNAVSKFNFFKRLIRKEIDYEKDDLKKINFLLNENNVDRYHDKIMNLMRMLTISNGDDRSPMGHVALEPLLLACAKIVYAFYGKELKLKDAKAKELLPRVERETKFYIVTENFLKKMEMATKKRTLTINRASVKGKCFMIFDDEDAVLCKGSLIMPRPDVNPNSYNERMKNNYFKVLALRQQHANAIDTVKYVNENGDEEEGLFLNRDIRFSSSYECGLFVLWKNLSPRRDWINLLDTKLANLSIIDINKRIEFHIRKSNIIIVDDNEYYQEIFNDEFDELLQQTNEFMEEVDKMDLELIYSFIKTGITDMDYIEFTLKDMQREFTIKAIKNAPFWEIVDNRINYSTYILDVEKEIKHFLKKGRNYQGENRAMYYIGSRRKNRTSFDRYSLNVTVKKRDGSGEYSGWLPVGDAKEIIGFIYDDGANSPKKALSSMVGKHVLQSNQKTFEKSSQCKIYFIFQMLEENGFASKDGRSYDITSTKDDVLRFIDNLEVKA